MTERCHLTSHPHHRTPLGNLEYTKTNKQTNKQEAINFKLQPFQFPKKGTEGTYFIDCCLFKEKLGHA